jgi:hypothetical protein
MTLKSTACHFSFETCRGLILSRICDLIYIDRISVNILSGIIMIIGMEDFYAYLRDCGQSVPDSIFAAQQIQRNIFALLYRLPRHTRIYVNYMSISQGYVTI